jgi:chaperonin cofactor prefoldin
MEEHDQKAEELEREVDDLERQGDAVGQNIDDARSDLEQKLGDQKAPGLLDEEAAAPGGTGQDE